MSLRNRGANLGDDIRSNYLARSLYFGIRRIISKKTTLLSALYLLFLVFLGVFGRYIAPYDYEARHLAESGGVLRAAGPSVAHPLGTTAQGHDVLSRVIIGAEPTLYTAVIGGALIITIGLTIGVTAGYMRGWVDEVLMRFTDVAYSVPLIPFAIVLLAFLSVGFFTTVLVIGLLLWRSSARVLRSQVLQIRERSYVTASRLMGGSNVHVVFKHVIPNIAPMAVLFFAMGMGWAVILQAGLAFIGVTNPFVPSWGIMIRNAYDSGYMTTQIFWSLVPGAMISLTVMSAFMLGREFEVKEGAGLMEQTEGE